MSGLYPSLEDLQVDSYAKGQLASELKSRATGVPAITAGGLYSNLGLEQLMEYAGLDISQTALVANMPEEVVRQMGTLATITRPDDRSVAAASIKQGVRAVSVTKDAGGKAGIILKAIDKGVFVVFVWNRGPSALAGLRFGDQILQINGENVAGYSSDKAMDLVKKATGPVTFAARDRPYERAVTLQKDSFGHVGFVFKNGEITALVKDSSAARNGLLINHQLVEVNGLNVVGLSDDEIVAIFRDSPITITVTIMPTFIYKHLMKSVDSSFKKYMDRSLPEF